MADHETDGGKSLSQEPSSADQAEIGRKLFAGPCDFIMGAAKITQIPKTDLPEVAFAGRSNVGKSSLINALTGRKALARTSNTPGRTRQINFFDLDGRLMLADLPGYGFAKAPRSVAETWAKLINSYLKGRFQLRRTCLLIDARHGVKVIDRKIMAVLDAAAQSYLVVLTKCDKVGKEQLQDLTAKTLAELTTHTAAYPEVMITSGRKGAGIPELRAALASVTD